MIEETGADEITIFAELPHTHLAGTQMNSMILRNNKEVERIAYNPYYDSNFQYVNFLAKSVKVKKVRNSGDSFSFLSKKNAQ